MRRFKTLFLALICAGSLMSGAHAASASNESVAARVSPWLGTWSCKASDETRTMTFSPLFGGSAMRVSETGSVPVEELVTFDAKHQKWIDQHAQASGGYATLEGTQNGKTIVFSQVYPVSGPVLTVTMPSKDHFTTSFATTMHGKKITESEVCTKT